MILRCSFVSRRLCRESALRAKHAKQNVKVKSRGAVGALWRRMEAKHSAEERRMEASPRSKLPFIFEALTCIPQYMHALRYPCSWPGGYRLPFPGYRPVFEYFFRLKSSNSQNKLTTFPGHFLVHRLIARGLKLLSDCHLMLEIWTGHEEKSIGW